MSEKTASITNRVEAELRSLRELNAIPALRALSIRREAGRKRMEQILGDSAREMAPRHYSRRISRESQDKLHGALDVIFDRAADSVVVRVARGLERMRPFKRR